MEKTVGSYRFVAAGDICMSDHPLRRGYGIGSRIADLGVKTLLGKTLDIFSKADDVFANLETAVGDNEKVAATESFRCEERYLSQLKACGITAFSVANNHSLDHGVNGFDQTLAILHRQNLAAIGVADHSDNCIPVVRECSGIRTCWLAYNSILKPAERYPYATLRNISSVLQQISKARAECDHVMISCHWGLELVEDAPGAIRATARAMIDAGASVVLGHHPHVVQAFERYKSGVIAYSLGDFLLDLAWSPKSMESALLVLDLYKDRVGEATVVRLSRSADLRLEVIGTEEVAVVQNHETFPVPIDLCDPAVFGESYINRYRTAVRKNQFGKIKFLVANARQFGFSGMQDLIRRKLK